MKNKLVTLILLPALAIVFFASQAMSLDFKLGPASSEKSVVDESLLDDSPITSSNPVIITPFLESIEIKGNNLVPSDKILKEINIKSGDYLSQENLNSNLKTIYAMGFFSDVKADIKKTNSGTILVIKVKENPVLSGISISGNTVYSKEKILSIMKSKSGRTISFAAVQEDLKAIDSMYHKDGYILERVIGMSIDPDTNVLNIKIVEGMIDSVTLSGNTSTRDYVILRELNSKKGTVLNEKVLGKDLKRIFNLGFFANVTPDFKPAASPNEIILIINVKESKTNTINFGGGYGEREGLFGFIDLSAGNLFGTGQAMMMRGQSGQQQSTYQFKYTYPWFLPDRLGKRVSMTVKRWLTQGKNVYLLQTVENEGLYNGWDLTFSKPFTDEISGSLTFGSERAAPYGTATFEPYTSNTVGFSLSYDTRDNWMNPTKGNFFNLGIRRGWKEAGSGSTNFTKYNTDLNRYIPVAERQVIAGHAGIGFGIGDVPVGEIYYAGGGNTIRGYEPNEARIGKRRIVLNAEYRYTFSDMFQGVLFFDWGNAWNTGWPDLYKFISGKGFGVRLNTPMGPIRLDYGIGSNRSFSEGVLHFSIGQAF